MLFCFSLFNCLPYLVNKDEYIKTRVTFLEMIRISDMDYYGEPDHSCVSFDFLYIFLRDVTFGSDFTLNTR